MEQNLNQYKIFFTVAELGNISHAAEKLYISQPAISKAISKLEDGLNTTLFTRNPRGVVLTSEGKILFEYLKTAFEAIGIGVEKIKKINELGIGHLKIGASATLCKYILIPYLKGFIEKYPHIKISIECQSTYHTLKLLENNKIDIALVVKSENEKNIEFYPIGEFEDIFVATDTYLENLHLRENNPQQTAKEVELELFKNANIMLLDEENVTRLYVDNYLNRNNIEVKHVLEVNNMDLLIDFAKIGLGVACVIKEFVIQDLKSGIIKEIPLANQLEKRTVGFAYNKSILPTNSVQSFIDFYRNSKWLLFDNYIIVYLGQIFCCFKDWKVLFCMI